MHCSLTLNSLGSKRSIRDLDFANDASSMLASAVEKLNEGFISQNDRRWAGGRVTEVSREALSSRGL